MGEACRNYITALDMAGVPVQADLIPNLNSQMALGDSFHKCSDLSKNYIKYGFKVIHTTPDLVTKYLEPMKYHIFHLFWETDRLPDWWVWALNLMDEIWTGCEWNKQVFIDSGVKKPIFVCPQAINVNPPETKPWKGFQTGNNTFGKSFVFYSIFQWIERKNPKALLESYWQEFEGVDDVMLVLKTYREKFTREETEKILNEIKEWKVALRQSHYPKVFLYPSQMSRLDIHRLHETGDVYVSTTRSEGWGIPIAEALMHSNPVISTNLGGVVEYLDESCAKLIPYKLVNVFNMEFAKWYETSQQWAEIDRVELKKAMRELYEDRDKVDRMGNAGKVLAKKEFSYSSVGNRLKERLEEI